MALESGNADIIRVEAAEAAFTGSKIRQGQFGQTSDTAKLVKRGYASGTYDFTSDDSNQVLLDDTKTITADKTLGTTKKLQFTDSTAFIHNAGTGSGNGLIIENTATGAANPITLTTAEGDININADDNLILDSTAEAILFKRAATLEATIDEDGLLLEAGNALYFDAKTAGSIAGDGVGGIDVLSKQSGTVTLETNSGSVILKPDGDVSAQFYSGGLLMSAAKVLTLAASTAGVTSLNMPHGTAPISPNNGDMWTTTAGLYVRINGSTVGPLS